MPQVLVIGAGPAGSVAACSLARAGWQVTLIEQHRFPRDKVCGECISSLGCDVLERLQLAHAIDAAGAVQLTNAAIYAQDGTNQLLALPRPMLGLSRAVLDDLLLSAARDAGAVVVQPARCEKLSDESGHVSAQWRDLQNNTIVARSYDIALLADGRSALLQTMPRPTSDLGIKAHFTGLRAPASTIGLYGVDGHYVGVAPIEQDRWNIALSAPAARVKACGGDLEALFTATLNDNPNLSAHLRDATRITKWLAAPLPRFAVRTDWPNRIIPIGNAAAALEPIGGEGMGLAMRSAELVVQLLARHGPMIPASARQILTQTFQSLWHPRRHTCRAAAMLVSHPSLAPAALHLLTTNKPLRTIWLTLAGKL